ncbi:hypothetical protein V8F06_008574 [Rhypophila decipiens]
MLTSISNLRNAAWPVVVKALRIGYSPWGSSDGVARHILETDPDERDEMLKTFVSAKQRELETVIVSSVLVAGLASSFMSWNWFPIPPYPTKIAILCSLIHSLFAAAIATQQLIALGRVIVCRRQATSILALLMGCDSFWTDSLQPQPRRLFSFAWQIPTILLGSSMVCSFVGIAIHVYHAAHEATSFGPETITAICVTISLCFGLGSYMTSWATVEWTIQDQLQGRSDFH